MKVVIGKVISSKMEKTAVISVTRVVAHPLYKKRLRKSKNFKADTNNLSVKIGDVVKITQTRPISKDKHYKIVGIEKESVKWFSKKQY